VEANGQTVGNTVALLFRAGRARISEQLTSKIRYDRKENLNAMESESWETSTARSAQSARPDGDLPSVNPETQPITGCEKYIKVFGRLSSLGEPIPWATGVSNMLDWLTWDTSHVLGISKTEYWKRIVKWSLEDEVRDGTLEEKVKYVSRRLAQEMQQSEQSKRDAQPTPTIASPMEALRRAKFFSEDYLNKEFDIFWTLVSDKYLDEFYGRFTKINGGGRWSTHGNSGLFMCSTRIKEMQMDNLSYNETEALLVANELKLRGRKNRDQMLKYALMFKLLRDRGFIVSQSRFLLLFIGATKQQTDWKRRLEEEKSFCKNSSKLCQPDVIEIADSANYESTTWSDLTEFNEGHAAKLNPQTQQVERKLLWGFNESLSTKAFMQGKIKP
jgi:hypothetical protein